jgi:cytochrome c biogenesis protein CcmG, thiol:disulfide interchange protein DsbE
MTRFWLWAPLALFLTFFGVVAYGLKQPPSTQIRSKMINKPLPKFSLPPAHAAQPGLGTASFAQGQPRLLNIFASWCIPCIEEAPVLKELADKGVPIDAVDVKDRPQDLERFLKRYGNPYQRIGADNDSAVQLALGSSGVPETFVIDGKGVIRHQHIGDIRREDIPTIMAQLRAAAR